LINCFETYPIKLFLKIILTHPSEVSSKYSYSSFNFAWPISAPLGSFLTRNQSLFMIMNFFVEEERVVVGFVIKGLFIAASGADNPKTAWGFVKESFVTTETLSSVKEAIFAEYFWESAPPSIARSTLELKKSKDLKFLSFILPLSTLLKSNPTFFEFGFWIESKVSIWLPSLSNILPSKSTK